MLTSAAAGAERQKDAELAEFISLLTSNGEGASSTASLGALKPCATPAAYRPQISISVQAF